jgi:hypothetical protein
MDPGAVESARRGVVRGLRGRRGRRGLSGRRGFARRGIPGGRCQPGDLACNPTRRGFPSPLESDRGWGGGQDKWAIVDGRRSYGSWANGLAFTGGHANAKGGSPYVEPAGVRHAIIDFGSPKRFDRVVVWQHGVEYTPAAPRLAYWADGAWVNIPFERTYGQQHEPGQGSGYSDSDVYLFKPVVGSKVRYSFDNRGKNIRGTWNIHGWIYEVEVYAAK